MELNYLRAFYEVAKIGRFSEAAKRLNISQSALSRSVALLEEGEGVQLFLRSKKGVGLTPIGQEVFHRCEDLFQKVQEIEMLCRGTREVCEGPLLLMTTDHIVNDLLIQPLQSFRRKYPMVVPSLQTGSPEEIVEALLTTDCEFGLSFAKVVHPQIEYKVLQHDQRMALVCDVDIWRKHKSSSEAKTLQRVLQNVGYICSRGVLNNPRSLRVLKELFGEIPRIGLETNNQEAQKRFCLEGGGIAYLGRFMVEKEIERGRLVEIHMPKIHDFHLWVATRKGRQLSLAAKTFLDHLRTAVGA